MDSVSERLDNLSKALKVSLSQMSEAIGCDRGLFSQVKGNATGIPSLYIAKLAQVYPDMSIEYMVTGEGDPLKSMHPDKVQLSTRKMVKNLQDIIADSQTLLDMVEPMTTRKITLK